MAPTDSLTVQSARIEDAEQLLEMMKGLAAFEGYIDDFKVTLSDVQEMGFGQNPLFKAFVAFMDNQDDLKGMAITYIIPWTYDLKPVLILKELFVREDSRSGGIGAALFRSVEGYAREIGASKVQWTVLKDNVRAKKFYQLHRAHPDPQWDCWLLEL